MSLFSHTYSSRTVSLSNLGSIPQGDFRDVLQERFRAGLASRDLEALESGYRDPEDPRKVNHVRLLRDVHPTHTAMSAFDSYEEEQVWAAAESLRQKIRRRCDYLTPGELRRPFKHFARSRKDKEHESRGGNRESRALGGVSSVSPADLSVAIRDLGKYRLLQLFSCVSRVYMVTKIELYYTALLQ